MVIPRRCHPGCECVAGGPKPVATVAIPQRSHRLLLVAAQDCERRMAGAVGAEQGCLNSWPHRRARPQLGKHGICIAFPVARRRPGTRSSYPFVIGDGHEEIFGS